MKFQKSDGRNTNKDILTWIVSKVFLLEFQFNHSVKVQQSNIRDFAGSESQIDGSNHRIYQNKKGPVLDQNGFVEPSKDKEYHNEQPVTLNEDGVVMIATKVVIGHNQQ